MATKMDMSLDDIITSTKSRRGRGGGRGGAGRGAGGARRGGAGAGRGGAGNRPGQRTRGVGGAGPRRGAGRGFRSGTSRGSNADAGVWTHDKFQDSLGGGARKAAVSTARVTGPAKITISNLHYGVSDSDIIELFGELGNIRYASVHYDRSGRSMGKADVTFERRPEAQAAINQYNGVPLDGRPMQITWATAAATTTQQVSPRGSNLRQIQGKRIGRTSGGGGGGGGGFTRGRGRGGARGGGGRGGKVGKTVAPTAAELDAELEAYVSNRV